MRIAALLLTAFTVAVSPAVHGQVATAPPGVIESRDASFMEGVSDPATLTAVVEGRLARARQLLDRMLSVKSARTISNTLAPYDEMWGEIHTATTQAQVMAALHPDEAMRTAAEALNRAASAMAAEVPLRRDVFDAIAALDRRRADAATRYYIERELKEFRLAGVDRPQKTRDEITRRRDELTQAMDEFQRNIRNGGRTILLDDTSELEGLPPDFIARLKRDPSGKIIVTTNAVDARPVLLYARREDVRRRMLTALYNVAAPENVVVLDRILRIRHDLAKLLGHTNWASYDAASRMSGNERIVSEFIDRIVAAARPKAAQEYAEIASRKQADSPGAMLNLWDRQYYAELVRRASYDFDSQSLRPYFAFQKVLDGVLHVSGTIFGVTYRPVVGVPVWHPSVRVYEVWDGTLQIGRVYLDLHPRAGKAASGANVTTVRHGIKGGTLPEAILAASLPGGQPGDPGLMTHDEVRTLFHEFGHVVHRLSGGHQPWRRLSSLAIERDFSEAPSQMLEEWLWDPRTLASFATHYQTGEPIPAALVAHMRRAGEFGKALDVQGQMVLARVALSAHQSDPGGIDVAALFDRVQLEYTPFANVPNTHRAASFPHIGQAGYASAYYSYMWALVIAKDLFATFDADNLIRPDIGRRYREIIFSPGSSRPAAELVRAYLGRSFNAAAWERWLTAEVPAQTH